MKQNTPTRPAKAPNAAEFARMLSSNRFFAPLGKTTIQEIARLGTNKRLERGQLLFQKGDPADALFGIRRGQIKISSGTKKGASLTLNTLDSGEVFGEIALLDGQARTASAAATETTELYVVRRSAFLKLLARTPPLALQLIELLCARIRWLNDRVEDAAMLPLSAKLAQRLASLADDFGNEIIVSQQELAQFVSASREAVNRELQRLVRAKILRTLRGRIVVLDRAALRQLGNALP
jgi:CRP/FNR family cyclic AMP-dependent transcriptional regulator